MPRGLRVALVGDFNPSVVAHQAIPKALELAGAQHGVAVEPVWVHPSSISGAETRLAGFDGIWCVPASPYANTMGALAAIRYAREHARPFLGTCGGFQHALIEYARNVCGMPEAEHAETVPGAALPLILPLACSLVERSEEILLAEGGLLRRAYGLPRITEDYHCSYGLNRDYEPHLFRDGFQATARGVNGEVRAVELAEHPFYVAALFQPERRALRGEVPPLVAAFVASMAW
jgi:CTP synthase (UTP-ammonia lyase)